MIRVMALGCLLSLISLVARAEAPLTVRFGTQFWAPYQYYEDGHLEGIAIDALSCVMTRLDHSYEIVVKPWRRIQLEVASGALDAFFAASRSDDRDRFAVQSVPFIRQAWEFFLLKDNPLAQQPESLQRATVAARQNSNVLKWLNDNGYRIGVTPYDAESLIRSLKRGRVDMVMENAEVFRYHLKLMGEDPEQFIALHNINHDLGVYFGKHFIRRNPGFLERFNRQAERCSDIRG